MFELVWPAEQYLPGFVAALERGWSPDTQRPEARFEQLEQIRRDPKEFLALMVDREARGGPVRQPDGSEKPRIPSIRKWMWDGEFCGSIGLRWVPGTTELPPHVMGHIGYNVVPWKQRKGYATQALALMLPAAKAEGLPFVEITTEQSNVASQKVIESNGGTLIGKFRKMDAHGGEEGLRYRVFLKA